MMERIEKLKDFLIDNPDDSFIQHALALEYIKIGDDAEARRLFENILKRDEQYIGSYYHLAKLLERTGENKAAIKCYEAGMKMAKDLGEQHAYSELRSAFDEMMY